MINKEKIEFSPEKREKGKNIHLKISFYRHGEKTPQGELSELGLEQARKFGREKEIPRSGLKTYTSPFRRTIDTAEQIIKGIEEQNRQQRIFTTRPRFELAPPQWEHFDVIREGSKEAEAKGGQKGLCKTPTTLPKYNSTIIRAKGIITDEGGLLSHAAIVSREFKIPTVVGTKIATKILKDGDLVEVDADKGVVKVLKSK